MSRRIWLAKRIAISAFLIFHLSIVLLWNLPYCAIRVRAMNLTIRYLYPLGLWQNWAMFAPEPVKNTMTLQAIAIDKNGVLYNFAFPKMADFTLWQGVSRVRHSKYTSYFASDEFATHREFGARHVVRQLDIPAEAFPVEVELQYVVRDTPETGTAPDPMAPTRVVPIKAYRFPTREETRP